VRRLRVPLRQAATPVTRTQKGAFKSLPAPIGGWNARDSIAAMESTDAVMLDNFFPTPSDVLLRRGQDDHVTGFGSDVETLMAYNTASGTQKLFAAAGSAIYDATNAGAVGAAVQSTLTNARWQHINFATSGGIFLQAANGADKIRLYDGSSWEAQDSGSTHAITGVDTTLIIHLAVHKNRIWMVEKESLSAWYLDTDEIAGAANEFPLSGVAKKGGYLVAVDTWTLDAGDGPDDYWVAATSEGEIIVYKGIDPSTANTWALVGVWAIGSPIGRRSLLKWAGDLLIVTVEGVFPLSKALLTSQINRAVALTDKIVEAMKDAAELYSSLFGWQLLHYPAATMLFLNVPTSDGVHQYAMNTITGRWGRFKAVEANCWALFNGEPYFGGETFVRKFWGVFDDNGSNIEGDAKQAFSNFGIPQKKQWTMARPIFKSNGQPTIAIGLNVDYEDAEPAASLSFAPSSYGRWDVAVWDSNLWGGGLSVLRAWQSVTGLGYVAAPRIKIASQGIEARWQATDFVFKRAAIGP
jgi:hypothetical protein